MLLLIGAAAWAITILASEPSEEWLKGNCTGRCINRYRAGFMIDGRCWCADPASPDPREPTTMPHRHKDSFNLPEVYDGVDNMKYAPQDQPPTQSNF